MASCSYRLTFWLSSENGKYENRYGRGKSKLGSTMITARLCVSIRAVNHIACSRCSMGGDRDSMEVFRREGPLSMILTKF